MLKIIRRVLRLSEIYRKEFGAALSAVFWNPCLAYFLSLPCLSF